MEQPGVVFCSTFPSIFRAIERTSRHSRLVSFPNLHNINKVTHAEDFRNKNRLLVVYFLSIFVHISGSIRPITLIWASMERSFPPAEVEYRLCQFWSKVMASEVEERPRLVTASYRWHRSQWVKAVQAPFWWCFMLIFKNLSNPLGSPPPLSFSHKKKL